MIVGIDIGNTTVEIGFITDISNIKSYKLKTDRQKTVDDWFIDFYQILGIEKFPRIKNFVISSVVPVVEKRISAALEKTNLADVLFLGKDIKIPIKNNYKNPEEVGIDRLVNACATVKKHGAPVVVVDFGTAITFDVVNDKGEYEGGAIFPGIDASIQALFSKTAKLPAVNIENVERVVGKTTTESIQAGIYFGYLSLIEGMIEKINNEYGYEHKLVITGGNGDIISKGLKIEHIYDRYLSMEGIYLIYNSCFL